MTRSRATTHSRPMLAPRKLSRLIPMLAGLACLLATSLASADAMRCGSRIVSDGATRTSVRQLCGEPSDITTRTILRRPRYQLADRTVVFGDGLVEVPVEVWTYNFGPYKLMRRVRFVDGQVDDIETLGYGFHEPSERSR